MRALLLILLLSQTAQAGRRFLLAVGENHGEPGQQSLQFAESDARAVREVLVGLGGVAPRDARVLLGATADELRLALAGLKRDLKDAGADALLFVYVSSHAADGALLLRGTTFPLAELRQFAERAPVGVAVVIVDTCHAAWVTRAKGLETLTDRTVEVEPVPVAGRVFIASAGPFEPAQESDRLGGSYFTHHLVAGLRGAADRSADGRVTLWEAFGYAYAHTIEGTLGSRGGRQTPSYEVQLEGQRELVLTELARGRALLTLTQAQPADWVITALDGDRGSTRFTSNGPMIFSLDPGSYRIRTSTGGGAYEHDVVLEDGAALTLTDADLATWSPAEGRAKGGAPVTVAAGLQVGSPAVGGSESILTGLALTLGYEPTGHLGYALQLGVRTGQARTPSQTFDEQEIDLAAQLTWRAPLGLTPLRAGAALGAVLVRQQDTPRGDLAGLQPRLGGVIGARLPFAEGSFLDLSATVGGQYIRVHQGERLDPFLLSALTLGMRL